MGKWFCFGDFNEIMYGCEKVGGIPRTKSRMFEFWDCLDRNNLLDMGYSGHAYTWSNNQSGLNNIQERLDRGVATESWMEAFPCYKVTHLTRFLSDHCHIMVEWRQTPVESGPLGACPFCFETMWLGEQRCSSIIEDAWRLQRAFQDSDTIQQSKVLEKRLSGLCRMDELYWLQRSRVSWMREGDDNTKFFHNIANRRRRRNLIAGIRDGNGRICTERVTMERVFLDYFQGLFTTNGHLDMEEAMYPVMSIVVDMTKSTVLVQIMVRHGTRWPVSSHISSLPPWASSSEEEDEYQLGEMAIYLALPRRLSKGGPKGDQGPRREDIST
ncbi:hypothetical protein ACS0TY_015120 [Phlomoides rotata]